MGLIIGGQRKYNRRQQSTIIIMELDRPHRRAPSATSDLFICFSSRLSKSSAMRLSSKSMVSPGRSDNKPPTSLSASLSRKLSRKNGSLRGGQSPMFPPGVGVSSKRRGCAIENAEPSSPKVTCIGQVRVKTKKHGKKMKMNMKKAYRARRSGKDVSFRRSDGEGCLQHRNQRWVHLPMTICDALRALGSELNCFSTCSRPWSSSSSCFSRSEVARERSRGRESCSRSSSCGGSVCRWLVALHEGGGKRRDIELVVGEEGEEEEGRDKGRVDRVVMERECSRRRTIFDDVDFNVDEICEEKNQVEEEEAARVSICIPPKNALLLMRCRSDPVKMSALATKFWESPPKKDQEEEEESQEDCFEELEDKVVEETARRSSFRETEKVEALSRFVKDEEDQKLLPMEKKEEDPQSTEKQLEVVSEERQQSAGTELYKELIQEEKQQQQHRVSIDCREHLWIYEDEVKNLGIVEDPDEEEQKETADVVASSGQSLAPLESTPSKQPQLEEKDEQIEIQQTAVGKVSGFEQLEEDIQPPPLEEEREEEEESVKTQNRSEETKEEDDPTEELESGDVMEEESSALPECLLLMMCEPKLSMEVSKETWVCSTDFIRWLPERHRQHHLKKINPTNAGDEAAKNKKKKNRAGTNTESNHAPLPPPPAKLPAAAQKPPPQGLQPARSSCSFPIGGRVSAGVKEKKQANAAANSEPLVLTRCKSAPMRSAAAKLAAAPELSCFWKNRKIEPHRPATCGVGAARVNC